MLISGNSVYKIYVRGILSLHNFCTPNLQIVLPLFPLAAAAAAAGTAALGAGALAGAGALGTGALGAGAMGAGAGFPIANEIIKQKTDLAGDVINSGLKIVDDVDKVINQAIDFAADTWGLE